MCSSHHYLALGMALMASACFDTEQVELASRVNVDDFEDGDELANAASGFGAWSSVAYPLGQDEVTSSELARGWESAFAESLTFSLHEGPGAKPTGAVLQVPTVAPSRDLGAFKRIGFRAKFDPGEPAPPEEARLLCELFCSSADAERDDMDSDKSVVYNGRADPGVDLPGDWSTYSLSLAAFQQPGWQGQLFDEASCFSLVDAIRFRVETNMKTEGQAAAGTLAIDDVYLE